MKRLKYVLTIMSTSFMLVVLLNAILMSLEYTGEWASLSVRSIFQIFVTCLFIAVVITYGESITILREHFAITSYVIMMSSVFMECNSRSYFVNNCLWWSLVCYLLCSWL